MDATEKQSHSVLKDASLKMSIVLNVPTELPPPPSLDNAPMIKYPPFPPVPEGVSIIPFRDYKPAGIKRFLDPSEDDVELDGTGQPTATLNVKHVADKWKKKKRRMGEGDDGILRKYCWWEEWERDEATRRTAQMIDPFVYPRFYSTLSTNKL